MRAMVDAVLVEMSPEFGKLYSPVGRPSIPPEKLLRALLLQVLYSTRSERLLMEQLDYNLLFRWFVGLNMDDPVWDATVFTKNRERLLAGDIAQAFFARVLAQARQRGLLSDEHFTVDGSLIEAWARLKSFKRQDTPGGPADGPGHPAGGLAHHDPVECDRPTHHAPRGLRSEPVETQARGGDLRLAEDRRAAAQDPASRPGARELDVHLRLGGVQPGAHAQPGGDSRMSRRAASPASRAVFPPRAEPRPPPPPALPPAPPLLSLP